MTVYDTRGALAHEQTGSNQGTAACTETINLLKNPLKEVQVSCITRNKPELVEGRLIIQSTILTSSRYLSSIALYAFDNYCIFYTFYDLWRARPLPGQKSWHSRHGLNGCNLASIGVIKKALGDKIVALM